MRNVSSFNFGTGAPPTIVTRGLIMWFDAASLNSYSGSGTTWKDISSTQRTGTLTNGPTYSTTNGGIFSFDGTDDYVSVTGTNTLTEATLIAWLKRNGNQVDYTGLMFARGAGILASGMNLYSTSNTIGYHWNDTKWEWNSGLVLPDTAWCMAAISLNSTSAVAYLGTTAGITSATNTTTHSQATFSSIRLCHESGGSGNRYWKGDGSVFMLYNRALSLNEMEINFKALRGRHGI